MTNLYLYHGSLYNADGNEIERPTVMIEPELDMFHGWGNYDNMLKKCQQINEAGFDMELVELTNLPKSITAYIILRMMTCTQSGFIRNFHIHSGDPDPMTWLVNEISRVPIEIPDKPDD